MLPRRNLLLIALAALFACIGISGAGEMPETEPGFRELLPALGYGSIIDYCEAMCKKSIACGVLPHTNAGILTREEMERLFHAFQQVDGSITRRFGGAGLGLVLSQRLMAMMHGRISVESTKGRGSTFTVEIPALPEDTP